MVFDRWLFITAGALVAGGLLIVGSASNYAGMRDGGNASAFYIKHLVAVVVATVAMLIALYVPYEKLARRGVALGLLAVCTALLLLVLGMPAAGGAHRWLPVGPYFKLQPSELTKVFGVVFMAYMLSRKEDRVNELWQVPIPCLGVIGTLAFLIVIEPDLGSAVMLVAVAGMMIFVAGLSLRFTAAATGLGIVAFVAAIIAEPYRWARIKTYVGAVMDPSISGSGLEYQLNQSLIAIGNGGLTGTGFGQGLGKAFFVPAVHTDFIFSVVGEELGLLGTLTLLGTFLLIYWRGIRAARRAPDRFGFYLALGLTNMIVLQALINMGVCLGLLPTKGMPLPFISYGGSSLLATMTAMGLLINVSQHSN
jgi:cell division protein FtsW